MAKKKTARQAVADTLNSFGKGMPAFGEKKKRKKKGGKT